MTLHRTRRAKIVATLGPASAEPDTIARLFEAGADVFRLNFSHGEPADHATRVAVLRELEARSGRPIGILADLQGPKLRVGRFEAGAVTLPSMPWPRACCSRRAPAPTRPRCDRP